jgi:hypothetical protein
MWEEKEKQRSEMKDGGMERELAGLSIRAGRQREER